MAKMHPCPTCKKKISISAASCPNCGDPLADGWSKKGGNTGTLVTLVVLFGLLAYCGTAIDPPTPEEAQALQAKRAAEKVEKRAEQQALQAKRAAEKAERRAEQQALQAKRAAEKAEKKRKGFHCLSGWDGSHRGLVSQVKNRLRDPDSFEHVETRITPNKNGRHIVIMTYRARNGFGGMNIEKAYATVSNATCSATITAAGRNF